MATVEPVALRFVRPDLTTEVPSPPHDALTPQARRDHLAAHPRSYLGVTRAPEDTAADGSDHVVDLLEAGRAFLMELLDDGVFGPETERAHVVYRLERGDHRQTGLVCLVATEDYETGTVRVHENINSQRAQHLARHLRVVGVQSSPIALAYRACDEVTGLMARVADETSPLLDFTDETGLRQRLWLIDDPADVSMIGPAFADQTLYLIDGHHRAAASSADRRSLPTEQRSGHRMLAALFPYDELRSEAFHRILAGVDPADLDRRLTEAFSVRSAATTAEVLDRSPTELALALPDEGRSDGVPRWRLIDVPFDPSDRSGLNNIDPVRLSREVLAPLLGLDEAASDPRLSYWPGSADLEAVDGIRVGAGEALFLMRPISTAVLMAISDAGEVMPPKSTYFQPKVRSGIFIRSLD